jgi:sugar lactone lactonase YvrE
MRAAFLVLLPAILLAQTPFTGSVTVEKVATDFRFTEGPCWRSNGQLVFSDIDANTIFKLGSGGAAVLYNPSGNSNGLAEDLQGRLLMAQQGKRQVARLESDGTETPLATAYNGKRLNSPNDLAVGSDGSIYFTDPPYGITGSQGELGFSGVYRVTSSAEAPQLLVKDLQKPNGIAFSPDESLLYVADTDAGRVMAYDVQADGTLANGRVLIQNQGTITPDGIEVDSAGNLYIAGS